ncbi:MAG TPA: hypothetical protein VMI53_13005 [Opitutaceae bacterium]|nr:hypothetical protein [Opitutaceae bacterium]
MNTRVTSFMAVLLAGFTSVSAAQYSYTITDLGTLGGSESYVAGVNYSGQVVGTSTTTYGVSRAFAWWHGTMIDLGTLGGDYSSAAGINDHGLIVGTAATSAGVQHAFIFSFATGIMTDLGTLGGDSSYGNAINNNGIAVGSAAIAYDGSARAFAYYAGVMHDLGTLGGDYSEATLINDANVIAGDSATTTASVSGNVYPFVFANGTMLKIFSNIDGEMDSTEGVGIAALNNSGQIAGNAFPYPVGFGGETGFFFSQGTYTYLGNVVPAGLNNAGQMVGTVVDFLDAAVPDAGASQYGPFIYSGGVLTFLDTLTDLSTSDFSFLVSANAISDSGYIVGIGHTTSNETHAFLMTPIPSPSH